MSFFDKKQDVLNIELTQYGKHLLSKGKFKPAYYAFFDDDIIYDSEYAGFTEERNDVGDRIRDETPTTKVQYMHNGAETNLRNLLLVKNEEGQVDAKQIPEKMYALSAPLGNSSLSSEYAPSWNIKTYKGEISSSAEYKTGSFGNQKIPQIKMKNITYNTFIERDSNVGRKDVVFGDYGDPFQGSVSNLNFAATRFDDGTFIKIEEDYILMQVDEQNSPFLRKNFDLEVFQEEITEDGESVLKPLYFEKTKSLVDENNILLDQEDLKPTETSVLDSSFVEHFFNIYVDEEISRDVFCKNLTKKQREDLFPEESFNCSDRKLITDISGLYDSNVTEKDLEEDC